MMNNLWNGQGAFEGKNYEGEIIKESFLKEKL
jgi:hypothetical protein